MPIDLMDDEEEVLVTLADTLTQLIDCVGGPIHAAHILKPLEKLCCVEENTVREKVCALSLNYPYQATEGIKKVIG